MRFLSVPGTSGRIVRWVTWLAGSTLAFWLLAWLLLPAILASQLERHASDALGRRVEVESIHVKPWSLELELMGLRVGLASENSGQNATQRLSDDNSQLSIKRLYVDAELTSLVRLAPVLDAVRIERPVLRLQRTGPGQHDLQDVLDRLTPPHDPPDPDTGPARLAIYNIQLLDGRVDLLDAPKSQRHDITDIELSIPFVNTLGLAREVRIHPKLAFKLNGSAFETEGDTQPFHDELNTRASLNIADLNLTPYLAYLPTDLPVRPMQAVLGARLNVEFAQKPQPSVRVTGHVTADAVALADHRRQPLLQVGSARMELADVRPLERVILLGHVEVNEPQLTLTRDARGQLNALPDNTKSAAANPISTSARDQNDTTKSPAIGTKPSPWTLGLSRFVLNGGVVNWSDALTPDTRNQPARLRLSQLQVQASQLSWPLPTAAAQAGRFEVSAQLSGALTARPTRPPSPRDRPATLDLTGQLLATETQATAKLDQLPLSLLAPYTGAHLRLAVQGTAGLDVSATWKPAAPTGNAATDDLTVALSRLDVNGLKLVTPTGTEVARWQTLAVRNAQWLPLQRTVTLGQISVVRPQLMARRNAQGQFMWTDWLTNPPPPDLAADASGPATSNAKGNTTPAWRWQLRELSVSDGVLGWRDEQPAQPVELKTSAMQLRVNNLTGQGGVPAKWAASLRVAAGQTEPGTLSGQGSFSLGVGGTSPQFTAQLDGRRLPAHALMPYVAGQMNLNVLRADTSFSVNLKAKTLPTGSALQLTGDATLEDVRARTPAAHADPTDGQELLQWKTLNLKGISVGVAPGTAPQVSIQSGALSDFFARIVIEPDGRINLQDVARPAPPSASDAATASTPDAPARISIGPFSLVNGSVDFSDRFIRPNYRSNLSDLTGRLGGFSSEGAVATADGRSAPQMAELELRGKAEGTASLEIVGKLNPLATPLALDIEGRVRDLELPPLSPYTIKYTGHGIERGKLSLDVAYTVQPNGQLTARNQLVLNQLTFGEPVAGASTTLPVRLAVALLADRRGVIDLDLPISGSLNDPEFSLVPIVFKIIGNIIVKAITAPFALLTGALGGTADELSQVAFVPGTAQLEPGSADKLAKLAQALIDKPNLQLTVVGNASLANERDAFQRAQLKALLLAEQSRSQPANALAAPTAGEAAPPATLTGADHTRWLTAVYKRTDMPKPRNAIGMAKDIAPADMEALLLAQIAATETHMQELAVQRGVAVRDQLARLKVPTERLFLGAPTTQTTQDDTAAWRPTASLKLAM